MKVIITGASGLVATELTLHLLEINPNIELTLVSRNPNQLVNRYKQYLTRIRLCNFEDLLKDDSGAYDACIHTAFARSSSGEQIVESLKYTECLCKWVRNRKIPKFVNISSQSVYGNSYEPFINETADCAPGYMYALAKYSSEIIVQNIFDETNTKLVNLRLASVCEKARFLRVFVENVINHKPIELVAPHQIVSFIDIRDVANAITTIILAPEFIAGDYNLGSGQNYSIREVSELVNHIGQNTYNFPETKIILDDNGSKSQIGMSINKLCTTYNWEPQYGISDMIISVFNLLLNATQGEYPTSFKLVYNL